MKAFGLFALTKREQRLIIIIVLALIGFVLVRHYREVATIFPPKPTASPTAPTASPSIDDESGEQDNAP
jgi:hypothetical protein